MHPHVESLAPFAGKIFSFWGKKYSSYGGESILILAEASTALGACSIRSYTQLQCKSNSLYSRGFLQSLLLNVAIGRGFIMDNPMF